MQGKTNVCQPFLFVNHPLVGEDQVQLNKKIRLAASCPQEFLSEQSKVFGPPSGLASDDRRAILNQTKVYRMMYPNC